MLTLKERRKLLKENREMKEFIKEASDGSEISEIEAIGRRWRDSYGNTYHTVSYRTDKSGWKDVGITYGYEDHWKETLKLDLQEEGLIPEDIDVLWRYCQENDIDLDLDVVDVSRKKDL